MKSIFIIFILLIYSLLNSKDYKNVRGIGFALEYSEALKQAKRDALESSVGVFLSSKTIIEQQTTIEDKVISKTDGMIKKYQIISEETLTDGSKKIVISAEVTDVIKEFVQNDDALNFLLKEMNLPNFAVLMTDTKGNRDKFSESLIKKYLKQKGFRLKYIKVDDVDDLDALEKQHIDYLFKGSLEYEFLSLNSYGIKNMKSMQLNMESELIDCKTKDIVSSQVVNNKVIHVSERTARKKVIDKACPEIMTLLINESLALWSENDSQGSNSYHIIIKNIGDVQTLKLISALKNKFSGQEEIFDKGFLNNQQMFEINTFLTPNELANLFISGDYLKNFNFKLIQKTDKNIVFEVIQ